MIVGGHSIIYSTDAEADRAFFRDVLKFPNGSEEALVTLSSVEMWGRDITARSVAATGAECGE